MTCSCNALKLKWQNSWSGWQGLASLIPSYAVGHSDKSADGTITAMQERWEEADAEYHHIKESASSNGHKADETSIARDDLEIDAAQGGHDKVSVPSEVCESSIKARVVADPQQTTCCCSHMWICKPACCL